MLFSFLSTTGSFLQILRSLINDKVDFCSFDYLDVSEERLELSPQKTFFNSHIFSQLLCNSLPRSPANEALCATPRLSWRPGQGLVRSAGRRHPYLNFSGVIHLKSFYTRLRSLFITLYLVPGTISSNLPIFYEIYHCTPAHREKSRSTTPPVPSKCSAQTTKQKP
jgi:hypothetical protein